MQKKQNRVVTWIKNHKGQLIAAGVSVATIIAVVLLVRNEEAVEKELDKLLSLVRKQDKPIITKNFAGTASLRETELDEGLVVGIERSAHDVSEHIRNLHEGWKASQEKIATALEHGYVLGEGQTWVEGYRTGGLAA